MPTFSPVAGTYITTQSVTLADATAGASIYYTTDGTTPSTTSHLYAAPIAVNGSSTISAIATAAGGTPSSIASAKYVINLGSSQPAYSYKNVQIVGGGFVDGLYFHPGQQGLMYARTDVGGAYRWNNVAGGDTQWVPLTDFVGRFDNGFDLGVSGLAIDRKDSTRLYLAVGDYTESYGNNGAILISGDMGNTFTTVALPFKNGANDNGRNDGERLVVDPNNSKHLYLGTILNGLWESIDQAQTWNQVTAFPITGPSNNPEDPEVGVIFEDFIASGGVAGTGNSKLIYYGVSSPTVGLYVSNDGGVTFTAVPNQPTGYYPNFTSLDSTNNILYITYGLNQGCSSGCDHSGPFGPTAGQVWAYHLPTATNSSGTWTNVTPPQTTPSGGAYSYGSVVVDPSHANVLMVTTLNKYYPAPYDDVFRSVDSGATWANINTNAVRDGSLSPWVSFGAATPGPGNWLNHLVVDPFNSSHAMYGNGQTIWQTTDIQNADGAATSATVTNHANATHWTIGALGLEETVILGLASPPSGPAHLLSALGDLGGFTHTDLTTSPVGGAHRNPTFSTGTSIDFAQNNPLIVARVGYLGYNGALTNSAGSGIGSYSADGGTTWKPFATNPAALTTAAGTIAVSADGATLVWMPSTAGVPAYYSTDQGTTWTAATSPVQTSNAQITVSSDRVNPKKFYLLNTSGANTQTPLFVSADGGRTFALASSAGSSFGNLGVSPNGDGDLWLASGSNGLLHSTDSGTTFTRVNGVAASYGVGFGAAAPGGTYSTIYMVGQTLGDTGCTTLTATSLATLTQCVYRSIDGGATFVRINDMAHQYGSFNIITGDPRVFGRVYFGTPGRGIIEGDSPN